MNIYINQTTDNKFNIVKIVPTLIETDCNYKLENKEVILKTFNDFNGAVEYAKEYYRKIIKK